MSESHEFPAASECFDSHDDKSVLGHGGEDLKRRGMLLAPMFGSVQNTNALFAGVLQYCFIAIQYSDINKMQHELRACSKDLKFSMLNAICKA